MELLKMKKVITSLGFSLLLLSLFFATTVSADDKESEEVSDVFVNFIVKSFDNPEEMEVLDSNGNDITQNFINETNKLYEEDNYQAIQDIIDDQNLSISYERNKKLTESEQKDYLKKPEVTEKLKGNSINIDNNINAINTKSKTKVFYHLESASSFTKEWTTDITGHITYKTLPMKQIMLVTEDYNWDANFGAAFNEYQENISTSSSYTGLKGTFKASYKMMATLQEPITGIDLPIGDYNFGNHTDSFSFSVNDL